MLCLYELGMVNKDGRKIAGLGLRQWRNKLSCRSEVAYRIYLTNLRVIVSAKATNTHCYRRQNPPVESPISCKVLAVLAAALSYLR